MEIWKPVPGYENIYEVSSLGNVRSVERIDPAGRRQQARTRTPQVAKRGGYLVINLRKDRKSFAKKVHHLVALAFLGDPGKPFGWADGCVEVNHKDGNKHNNQPDNLEYCTRAENIEHAYRTGLHDGSLRGVRNGRAKLTPEQVQEIRALYTTGQHSIPQLGRRFNVGKSTIGYIVQGVTWKHL
jgi:NUMOD4 motif/HNH endonuclease